MKLAIADLSMFGLERHYHERSLGLHRYFIVNLVARSVS
jgi:hypothetical protein